MTLTNVRRDVLLKLGRRLQIPSLVRQARYTHDLALGDAPVAWRVGSALLADLDDSAERLVNDHTSRAMADVHATLARQRVTEAVRRALDWRREFTQLVKVALLRGLPVPRDAATSGRSQAPRRVAAELATLVRLGRHYRVEFSAVGVTRDLLRQGTRLAKAVGSADTDQQLAHRATRSDAVYRMWETAARVFLTVQQVNAYGRAVHAADRATAREYNLKLLAGNAHHDPARREALQSRFIAHVQSALNSSASNGLVLKSAESSLSRNRPTSSTAFSQSRMTVGTASRLPRETREMTEIPRYAPPQAG